jgi:AraC family transcriptional regulator
MCSLAPNFISAAITIKPPAQTPFILVSVSVTSKALWYIESHINAELSLESIADAAGVSRFHLSRAFAASTGASLAGYMRARRLSEAAKRLVAGAPDILAVALEAGYGSHEAFTRAFRQQFGLTPDQLRAQADTNRITLQEPIRMDQSSSTSLAAPRLVKSGALLIFGLAQRCPRAGDPAIPALWNRFLPHLGHIQGQIGNVAYGAIYNADDSGDYDYICGVEVKEFPAHPPEFTRLRIPPQTCAVFEHSGHVAEIAGTWKAIWEHGLAGLDASDGPAFERYDEKFDGRTGLGGLEIWVPVRV